MPSESSFMRWILNFRVDEILSSSAFCSWRALVVLPEEGRPEKMMRGITTLSSSWLLDSSKGLPWRVGEEEGSAKRSARRRRQSPRPLFLNISYFIWLPLPHIKYTLISVKSTASETTYTRSSVSIVAAYIADVPIIQTIAYSIRTVRKDKLPATINLLKSLFGLSCCRLWRPRPYTFYLFSYYCGTAFPTLRRTGGLNVRFYSLAQLR